MKPIPEKAAARAAGLPIYRSSTPCKHGHVGSRYVHGGGCVDCDAGLRLKYRSKPDFKVRCAAATARWRAKHPGEGKAGNDIWRAVNADRVSRTHKAWLAANPESNAVYKRHRRARKKAVGGTFTIAQIRALYRHQKGKCAYFASCGTSIKVGYHIDHITPVARGGSNGIRNIQLLCQSCNLHKHAKDPLRFAAEIGLLV